MALKKTQAQLKREFKKEIAELKLAIRLKCADCLGFFLDPYEPCTDEHCPLRSYYPRRGVVRSNKKFRKEMVNLAKARDNHPDLVSEIDKGEPRVSQKRVQKARKEI